MPAAPTDLRSPPTDDECEELEALLVAGITAGSTVTLTPRQALRCFDFMQHVAAFSNLIPINSDLAREMKDDFFKLLDVYYDLAIPDWRVLTAPLDA